MCVDAGCLAACQLARVTPADVLRREVKAVTATFLSPDYVERELMSACSSIFARATSASRGELVGFAGRNRTPIYGYSKLRLIELLEVTPAEQTHMAALISDTEKARRHLESDRRRRRAAGMVAREAYEANAAKRRLQVIELRTRGMTWRAIGAELGVSEREARRVGH